MIVFHGIYVAFLASPQSWHSSFAADHNLLYLQHLEPNTIQLSLIQLINLRFLST